MNVYMVCATKRRRSNAGIVLPMALILLVIISMSAMLAVKISMSGEQVTNSLRSNTVAAQAAETALRYCEDQVRRGGTAVSIQQSALLGFVDAEGLPNQWQTRSNWAASSPIVNVLSATLTTSSDAPALAVQPRCIIEQYRLPRVDKDLTLSDPYLVTAVGYTSDYRTDSTGKILSGGEVWLQSVFRP